MEQVQHKIIRLCFAGLFFFVFLNAPRSCAAATADYQRCKTGENCTVGEFLYDDSYTPIATASCTLSSRDPSGAVFINSAGMTATTDGWYSYSVATSGQTEGLYRSQMCCTSTEGYQCLDKSFYIGASFLSTGEVAGAVWDAQTGSHNTSGTFGTNLQNPVLTAATIWGYSSRTLSSFGTLVSEIWSYSTRSVSSFSTLLADFWGYGTRTLTGAALGGGGELATKESVEKASYSAAASVASVASNKNVTETLSFEKEMVAFNLLVHNPAPVPQKVPFVYYLPPEVKKEDIVKIDEETIRTDTINIEEKPQTYSSDQRILGVTTIETVVLITGETELPPAGTKKIKIKVKDVWQIARDEVDSLRRQAATLFDPLKNTSYLAQGAILKTDIDVHLDQAWSYQQNFRTPQGKITAYRKAAVEVATAKNEIESLKNIVANAGASKTMFGFIGGVQTTAVWGMVLVFLGGFVFMTLYMKRLAGAGTASETKTIQDAAKTHIKEVSSFKINWLMMFYVFAVSLAMGAILAAMILGANKKVLGVQQRGMLRPIVLHDH